MKAKVVLKGWEHDFSCKKRKIIFSTCIYKIGFRSICVCIVLWNMLCICYACIWYAFDNLQCAIIIHCIICVMCIMYKRKESCTEKSKKNSRCNAYFNVMK